MNVFVFCRKIMFKLIIWPNDVSEWKKHLKIDLETRSYDFLTKNHEKNPMSGNIRILAITSESDLIDNIFLVGVIMPPIWNSWKSIETKWYVVVLSIDTKLSFFKRNFPFEQQIFHWSKKFEMVKTCESSLRKFSLHIFCV